MSEKPILFSTPMVKAILAGNKTQTRRIVKGDVPSGDFWKPEILSDDRLQFRAKLNPPSNYPLKPIKLPYAVGDRLWVRETWGINYVERHGICPDFACIRYAADGKSHVHSAPGEEDRYGKYKDAAMYGLNRSSLFMPKWAARIWLEVTGVRVERLQDISNADALLEGGRCMDGDKWRDGVDAHGSDWPRFWFRDLWNSINGKGAWSENPWVWVIEFKRVEAPR
jgi:hypothetical protein